MYINLYCFPFAGGSAYSYNELLEHAEENIHIIPLELPGRGNRFTEPLLSDLDEMVNDCYEQLKGRLQVPYAFYGHSMGALLAYLVLKKVLQEKQPLPAHLFVSGFAGPAVALTPARRKVWTGQELKDRLKCLAGVPASVLKSEAFMQLYEPILVADLTALKSYEYRHSPPLPVPLTVFAGDEDEVSLEESHAWSRETTFFMPVYQLKGKHQFWKQHAAALLLLIKNHIRAGPIMMP